jgi:hypothetical protein
MGSYEMLALFIIGLVLSCNVEQNGGFGGNIPTDGWPQEGSLEVAEDCTLSLSSSSAPHHHSTRHGPSEGGKVWLATHHQRTGTFATGLFNSSCNGCGSGASCPV